MHKFPKAGLVFYRVLYSLVLLILVIVVVKAAGDRIGVLGVLLLFALSYLVSVLIHESGHILAALVSGWRILIIAIRFLALFSSGKEFPSALFAPLYPWGVYLCRAAARPESRTPVFLGNFGRSIIQYCIQRLVCSLDFIHPTQRRIRFNIRSFNSGCDLMVGMSLLLHTFTTDFN